MLESLPQYELKQLGIFKNKAVFYYVPKKYEEENKRLREVKKEQMKEIEEQKDLIVNNNLEKAVIKWFCKKGEEFALEKGLFGPVEGLIILNNRTTGALVINKVIIDTEHNRIERNDLKLALLFMKGKYDPEYIRWYAENNTLVVEDGKFCP